MSWIRSVGLFFVSLVLWWTVLQAGIGHEHHAPLSKANEKTQKYTPPSSCLLNALPKEGFLLKVGSNVRYALAAHIPYFEVDECAANPCKAGLICVDPSWTTADDFVCKCAKGDFTCATQLTACTAATQSFFPLAVCITWMIAVFLDGCRQACSSIFNKDPKAAKREQECSSPEGEKKKETECQHQLASDFLLALELQTDDGRKALETSDSAFPLQTEELERAFTLRENRNVAIPNSDNFFLHLFLKKILIYTNNTST
eukprot:TRINITY_DN6274_c1_g1_i11.p1 TRINITY_DN6274_c1_g1~~TRINITY_DN6274_c1_g1_i11.p1  ORF type:complete len:275 (+),score=35.87 TRINITY_DN6274_c1_g1_i11:53-826(+)